MRKSKKIFWLFLAPCLITFCIAVVIPTLTGICNYNSDCGKCGCICSSYAGNSKYKREKFIQKYILYA